jgi:phosphotriesterase-related protein
MNSINRRKFLQNSAVLAAGFLVPDPLHAQVAPEQLMTVSGPRAKNKLGFILSHEHILVDFIGADKVSASRYDADAVFKLAVPILMDAKRRGCETIVECTPAYLGRDVRLLEKISDTTKINIVTNTGYYGAAKEKYLPAHAYQETAEQLASRWIKEWKKGIDGTRIKPGFIKTGVDQFPLSAVQKKLIEAAAITHINTGLTIAVHTGNGAAAMEQMDILKSKHVSPASWIWVHAQNEKDRKIHIEAANAGGWVSFDGFHTKVKEDYLRFLTDMKKANLLEHVLISHDSGWYHVGEPGGGDYKNYNGIIDILLPAMKDSGFSDADVDLVFKINPGNAFCINDYVKNR